MRHLRFFALLLLLVAPLLAQPYNGTISGTLTFAAGRFGNAPSGWSGSNFATLPVGANPTSSTSFAIEGWFRTSTSNWMFLIGNAATPVTTSTITLWAGFGAAGPRCQIGDGTAGSWTNQADNNWHHVRCDLSGTTVRMFVDGVMRNSYTTTFVPPTSAQLRIGSNPAGGDVLVGQIDEIAVWNASQGSTDFTPRTTAYVGNESGLRALYPLNSNINDIVGPGPLTAGTLTTAIGLDFSAATGGSSPYTYQLQSYAGACGSGTFANDGVALTSQTSTALFSRTGGATRCFRVVVTDAASATANSNEITAPPAGGGGMRSY